MQNKTKTKIYKILLLAAFFTLLRLMVIPVRLVLILLKIRQIDTRTQKILIRTDLNWFLFDPQKFDLPRIENFSTYLMNCSCVVRNRFYEFVLLFCSYLLIELTNIKWMKYRLKQNILVKFSKFSHTLKKIFSNNNLKEFSNSLPPEYSSILETLNFEFYEFCEQAKFYDDVYKIELLPFKNNLSEVSLDRRKERLDRILIKIDPKKMFHLAAGFLEKIGKLNMELIKKIKKHEKM